MIKDLNNQYEGFTLMEVLVVMAVMIIIGGLGTYSFGGLRDTIVVNQDVANIKMDVQRAQHSAMLLRRAPNEPNWPYGVGIDFTRIGTEGRYSFFKWFSDSADFNPNSMNSQLVGFDNSNPSNIIGPNDNGKLPVPVPRSNAKGRTVLLPGFDDTYLKGGYNVNLSTMNGSYPVGYVLFESVTGRAFLYDTTGYPVNYATNLVYNRNIMLTIEISRNQGSQIDLIVIHPGSGHVTHTVTP